MRRRTQRLWLVAGGLGVLGLATILVLSAMGDNLVFFYSPTELQAKSPPPSRLLRIGGLVEAGSVIRGDNGDIHFSVTDTKTAVTVSYHGLLPDLFREGQGVVVQGHRSTDGGFTAVEVLARHDETYMPPEVAKALKDQGVWRGDGPKTQGVTP